MFLALRISGKVDDGANVESVTLVKDESAIEQMEGRVIAFDMGRPHDTSGGAKRRKAKKEVDRYQRGEATEEENARWDFYAYHGAISPRPGFDPSKYDPSTYVGAAKEEPSGMKKARREMSKRGAKRAKKNKNKRSGRSDSVK